MPRIAKFLGVAACAALLVSTASSCNESHRPNPRPEPDVAATDGPVSFVGGEGDVIQTASFIATSGDTVVFGATEARNEGEEPATLTSARLVGEVKPQDATVEQVRVIDRSASPPDLIGAGPWPFEDYARRSTALEGFRLKPGAGVELLFVTKVNRSGRWSWSRTELAYVAGGMNYSADIDFGFVICPDVHCP